MLTKNIFAFLAIYISLQLACGMVDQTASAQDGPPATAEKSAVPLPQTVIGRRGSEPPLVPTLPSQRAPEQAAEVTAAPPSVTGPVATTPAEAASPQPRQEAPLPRSASSASGAERPPGPNPSHLSSEVATQDLAEMIRGILEEAFDEMLRSQPATGSGAFQEASPQPPLASNPPPMNPPGRPAGNHHSGVTLHTVPHIRPSAPRCHCGPHCRCRQRPPLCPYCGKLHWPKTH